MLECFGFESNRRAVQAKASGAFEQELLPIVGVDAAGRPVMHDAEEGVRSDVSLAAMAELKPLREGGMLTAATSSQTSDGASGVIVVSEAGLKALSLPPLARLPHITVLGASQAARLEDRKSVGWGRCVSDRVESGG